MSSADTPTESWEELKGRAKQIVDALIARLPDELRQEALRIGYELNKRCEDERLLGAYTKSAHLIELFLEEIREYCLLNSREFCTELEKTYLHEFGHHLGLEEEEMDKYGL
jgi:predicted Zn-dependent protease with MMP-like domain